MMLRALSSLMVLLFTSWPLAAETVTNVKARGHLMCGVSQDTPGLATQTLAGVWSGIEVDFCRAIAAAVLGDAQKVKFRPLASPQRFDALQRGEIDILARSERLSMSSDMEAGITFAAVLYHSGLAVLVPKQLGVASVRELSGQRLCVAAGDDSARLGRYLANRDMRANVVEAASWQEVTASYRAQQCNGLVADVVLIAAARQQKEAAGQDILLPEQVTINPVGIVVRSTDTRWFKIVRWTKNVLAVGEWLDIGTAGVKSGASASSGDARTLLGQEGDIGAPLGLDRSWAGNVLRQVGHYGEIYARNLGENSPLRLPRGPNRLSSDGGLIVVWPVK